MLPIFAKTTKKKQEKVNTADKTYTKIWQCLKIFRKVLGNEQNHLNISCNVKKSCKKLMQPNYFNCKVQSNKNDASNV